MLETIESINFNELYAKNKEGVMFFSKAYVWVIMLENTSTILNPVKYG